MGRIVGGGMLLLVAAFMLLGYFRAGAGTDGGTLAALLIGVLLPAGIGIALLTGRLRAGRASFARLAALREQTLVAEVLKLAAGAGGRVTVVELVQALALPHDEAEQLLTRLAIEGRAEVEITDAGLLVYLFPDVRDLPGKAASRGVLE